MRSPKFVVISTFLVGFCVLRASGSFFGSIFTTIGNLATPTPTPPPGPGPILGRRSSFISTPTPTPGPISRSFVSTPTPLPQNRIPFASTPQPQNRIFSYTPQGTLTVANSPSQFKPPINQPYANRLAFLATLPLNERLGYFKAQILKTGAKALTKGSNTLGRASQNLNSAAANLYSPRPVLQPLNAGRPGTGIQGRDVLRPGVVDDAELLIDPAFVNSNPSSPLTFGKMQELIAFQRLSQQQERLREINRGPAIASKSNPSQAVTTPFNLQSLAVPSTCNERLSQLVGDIFIGNEMIPQVLDLPPDFPLELTYRTVRTFPGMRLTAEATRFKPMMHWPAEQGALYTVVVSNLDINNRRNRTLSEFWHWFVGNVPGNSIDEGQEIFALLHPLVLPEGAGDHRYGYFVMKQPGRLDYSREGGPTDNCSPIMSTGRGPYRSTKEFIKKYGLRLVAASFLIIDSSQASIEIACEWQTCMGGEVFLKDLDCTLSPPRLR